MSKNLYSVSHLAKELGYDRRTLDARLVDVAHIEGEKNAKLYSMRDVIDAFVIHAQANLPAPTKGMTPEERAAKESLLLDTKIKSALVQLESDEIDLNKKKGNLIESDRVDTIFAAPLLSMRSQMMALPRRASMAGALKPQRELETILEGFVHDALTELVTKLREEQEADREVPVES